MGYSPNNVISLAPLVLRPKLISLVTEIFQYRYLTNVPPDGRVWHRAFLDGYSCRAVAQIRPTASKCLGPHRHSPKKRHLKHKAINLTPRQEGLKPGGTDSRGPDTRQSLAWLMSFQHQPFLLSFKSPSICTVMPPISSITLLISDGCRWHYGNCNSINLQETCGEVLAIFCR